MKPMTNSKARQLGKKELSSIFKNLQHKDGLTEKASASEFTYWYNKARNGELGNYIIYESIDSSPVHRADDAVISRDFYCQIDVFSTSSFETKLMHDTLSNLEEELMAAMFEVTMQDELFEDITKLYHQIIFVSKLYFIGGKPNGN